MVTRTKRVIVQPSSPNERDFDAFDTKVRILGQKSKYSRTNISFTFAPQIRLLRSMIWKISAESLKDGKPFKKIRQINPACNPGLGQC